MGSTDRAAEVWEPLLAVADAAGGHWPEPPPAPPARHFRARQRQRGPIHRQSGYWPTSETHLHPPRQTDRLAIRNLLLAELKEQEESGWGDLDGRPLDGRRMAKELGRYGVRVVPFKHGRPDGQQGLHHSTPPTSRLSSALIDAWSRYLPPPTDPTDVGYLGYCGYPAGQAVTDETPVTDPAVTAASEEAA